MGHGHQPLLLVALLLSWTHQAEAADAKRNVVVLLSGDDRGLLEKVVRERIRDAGALPDVRHGKLDPRSWTSPASIEPALAHIWIDVSDPSSPFLVLLDGTLQRGLLRRPPPAANAEVTREQLGHLVQSAVEALIAGDTIGFEKAATFVKVETKAAPSPTVVPAPAAPRPPAAAPWRVRAGGFYEVETFALSPPTFAHGPGFFLDAGHAVGKGAALGVRLTGQPRFPVEVLAPPFVVHVETWAARALGVAELRVATWWAVVLGAGGGVDLARVVPVSAKQGGYLASPSLRVYPMLRACVGVAYSKNVRLALSVALDVDVSGESYEVLHNGQRAVLFTSDTFRPAIIAEIGTP